MAAFPAGSPASYNSTEAGMDIDITQDLIYDYAHDYMVNVRNNIEGCWLEISKTWERLKLSWSGSSAEEAKEFNDRLLRAQESLFGKEGGKPGILNQVRAAALMASVNYDNAEAYATKLFDDFLNDLTAPSEPGAHPPTDVTDGPISVDYNNGPGVRYDNREVIGQYTDQNGVVVLLYEGDEVPDNDHDHTIDTKWLENGDEKDEVVQKKGEIEVQEATWKDKHGNWHTLLPDSEPSTSGTPAAASDPDVQPPKFAPKPIVL
jgi:hypothetical protein